MAATAVKWLYLTAFVLVAYWLHAGYRSLVAKGKQAQFRLEQRRRAGIPDSDKRPFDIAQADAAQARRRKALASQSHQNLHSIASSSSSSPFGHSISTRNRLAVARSPASSPLPPPGQSNRYDPLTYRNNSQHNQSRPYSNFASPDASSASSLTRHHQSGLAASHSPQDDDDQPQLPTREQIQAAMAATAAAAARGKKRGPSEARDVDEEDSVIAHRYNDRKRYHQDIPNYDSDHTTPDDEMDSETERGTVVKSIPSSNQRGAKRALDQVSMSRVSEDDETANGYSDASDDDDDDEEEEEEEEVEVPRQRASRAKITSRPTKRVAIRGRAGRKNRSLQDEMHDLSDADERDADQDRMDEDVDEPLTDATDEDMDDSMRSIRSRRRRPASSIGSRRSNASAMPVTIRDVSDSERDVGEEWTDPKTGLQWRMDEDDVMSEEETSKGTKRRVMVKRRVKRRLTVRREMRSKWGMPADSLHPDAGETVPHYVPAWLSEAEFEDAKSKGQLGFQVGENNDKGHSSNNGSPTPRSPSTRNLDALFHQPSSSLPLRSSPLSRSSTPLRQLSVSHRTSSPSLNSPGVNRRSRLSLAGTSFTSNTSSTGSGSGANSGTSSPSGMKPRLLDSAAKRRREEELLRKLKESKEKQQQEQQERQQASVSAQDTTSKASSTPSGATFAFGAPEKKEEKQSTPAPAGSPFSFGGPEKKEENQSKPPPAGPAFFFGASENKEETQSKPSPTKPSPFSFGSAPQVQTQASSQAAQASNSPAPFSFGANKPAEPSQSSTAAPAASSFSFSGPKKEEAPKPSSSTFSFNAPPAANAGTDNNKQKTGSATPFTFGAAPQTNASSSPAPFTFGAGGGAAGGASGGGGFTFNLGRK